jgi:hypothetical protein
MSGGEAASPPFPAAAQAHPLTTRTKRNRYGRLGVLYLWDRYQENGNYGTTAIITFGFTLLALMAMTVLFARAAPGSEAKHAV